MILASVVIIGIATGLGIIFSRSFSSQFTKLTYLAKEICKENFDVKVDLEGKGEMAQLVKNMHKMGTALKNAKKSKEEFIAMISHELKTPLTPIKIYASSLKRQKFLGELNQKQADAVDGIYFNTDRLERLIGDLLDVQKLELGQIKFENKWVVVEEFMDMVTGNLKSQTEQKGGQLINHTKGKIIMKSDTSRLSQVFSNLINNSIDFIPKNKGKIEINAQNKKDKVLFSVKDNGTGMTLETQKSLFQKFYQADTSITRKHGGTGLGLAICKGIVEGLGGKIWLESEVGKGTDVYFTIPRGTIDEDIDN
jgi:signal transduction histidine kinase